MGYVHMYYLSSFYISIMLSQHILNKIKRYTYMIYKMYKELLWNMYVLFIIFLHIYKVILTHFKENNKIFMI